MVKFLGKHLAIMRAVAVVSVVGALVTSVTYASLQSPSAALTGNSIQSATANLLVGTTSATSTAFAASKTGFTFANVVPGGPAQPANGNVFYLKNTGTTTLSLKLNVTGTPSNAAAIDLSKVNVNVTRTDGATQTATLQQLMDSSATGGLVLTDLLAPASTGNQYNLSVSMAADAYSGSGSGATVGPFDFVFSGTAALN